MAFYKMSIFLVALQTSFFFSNGHPIESIRMPEPCQGKTYCFELGNYPAAAVQKVMEPNNLNFTVIVPSSRPEIEHRDYDDDYIDIGCKKSDIEMPIYYIVDENDDVRVVLQSKIFKQIIHIQECEFKELKEGPSGAFTQGEMDKLHLQCENLILSYKFLVLSKDLSSVELAQTKGGLPVDCVCRARRS